MTELVETRPRTDVLRTVLEVAVVIVFVLLIWQNLTLRRQARAAATPSVRQHAFVARDAIGPVPVIDLAGRPGVLDLRSGRTTIAIVDPRCDSCRELVATLRGAAGVVVLSVAPVGETQKLARESGLGAAIHALGAPVPAQFQIYPQLFVVDRGKVVRTCVSLAECR